MPFGLFGKVCRLLIERNVLAGISSSRDLQIKKGVGKRVRLENSLQRDVVDLAREILKQQEQLNLGM
jgi:hypothetical protein